MPKLIDYPRTNYTGAWELSEIVDDTGGKCAVETAAKKLDRKVSGSFKAVIGSAVKFGLITSKRELLTTTTLYRRIKHAYDKTEELQFHREAFLTPPLFTQLCRKFRNRELPIKMLDVMLIREFAVEEINAQNVAKAFVDGCRMCKLLDDNNVIADIDNRINIRSPRRELANQTPNLQEFIPSNENKEEGVTDTESIKTKNSEITKNLFEKPDSSLMEQSNLEKESIQNYQNDAITDLFGLSKEKVDLERTLPYTVSSKFEVFDKKLLSDSKTEPLSKTSLTATQILNIQKSPAARDSYQIIMSGPGIDTTLDITDENDLAIAIALIEKIRRQLRADN